MPNPRASVQGQLEDALGAPLPDATVELESWSGQTLASTVTDGDGGFIFHGIGPGFYRLRGIYRGQAFERSFSATNPAAVTVVRAPVGAKPPAAAAANPAANIVSLNDLAAPKVAKKTLRQARDALRHRHPRQALRLGSKAVTEAPHWAEARLFRGVLWMAQKHYLRAEQDLRAAVAATPNDALALTALGADYERQKKLAPAGFYLQRAMQVQPGLWQEYFEMAQLNLDENQPRAAIANAGRSLAAIPAGPPTAHLLVADGNIRLRRLDAAKTEIGLYLEVAPHGRYAPAARRTLQQILRVQQRRDAAGRIPGRPPD
ncbi:MAG: carboxypeptidase regulatory-like domain-containing protein [Terriglobales bacterium]